jgi:hypothetical protein
MEPSVVRHQGVDRGSDFEVRRRGALLSYGASQGSSRNFIPLQWTRTYLLRGWFFLKPFGD